MKDKEFKMEKTILGIELIANSIERPFASLEDWSYKYVSKQVS